MKSFPHIGNGHGHRRSIIFAAVLELVTHESEGNKTYFSFPAWSPISPMSHFGPVLHRMAFEEPCSTRGFSLPIVSFRVL